MWPFTRKKWEKLGSAWTYEGVETQVLLISPTPKYHFLRDRDFRGIPAEEFEKIIFDAWFVHDEPAYKGEIFDCDDFAVCFMAAIKTRWANVSKGKEALAFGYISADVEGMGQHAFIWQMDDKGVIRFYEPQTGRRVDYKFKSVTLVET